MRPSPRCSRRCAAWAPRCCSRRSTTAAGFYAFIPTQIPRRRGARMDRGHRRLLRFYRGDDTAARARGAVRVFAARAERADAARPADLRAVQPAPRVRCSALRGSSSSPQPSRCGWVSFDSNPIHLRDPRSESVETLLELAASGDAQLLNLEAVAPDHATATEWASRLRGRPEIRNVITVDSLVPKDQDEKIAVLDDLKLVMGPVRAAPEGARGPRRLASSLDALEKASAERRDAAPLHAAVAGLRLRSRRRRPRTRNGDWPRSIAR